jgi:ribosomal protein S18 acetylase RimI-like enzyme
MVPLAPPLRLARPEDGPVLAEFINMAGEGLPLAVWQGMAGPGEDPWAIGAARQARRAEGGQIVVVDEGAGAIAGLTGYAIRAVEAIGDDMPAAFRPLQELENLAVGTWYVNALAVLSGHRGKGYGSRLLRLAEEIAEEEELTALSLIVAEDNAGARRLYAREGYEETARRPVNAAPGWTPATETWILMLRRLSDRRPTGTTR